MNDYQKDPLWLRIRDFQLDEPGAQFSFSKRLARENRWSHDFSLRVIEEYKRFCYIAVRAGHPVTPSEEIDQAWHLHLLYTRSYWDEFCGGILRHPFHHGPTNGGAEEGQKFREWYRTTLGSYKRTYGVPPPSDIWPEPEARFTDVAAFRRINTGSYWVIPKPNCVLGNRKQWAGQFRGCSANDMSQTGSRPPRVSG